jgi:2-polyprenyl-3-methyl-5-hydroxy-6-metoxy-1,4-benzoquinol methylase
VVVDLGCGPASFALAAARHGALVHAVDISQAMLDYARGKARAAGLEIVEYQLSGPEYAEWVCRRP